MGCHLGHSIVHLNWLLLSSYLVCLGDEKFCTHHKFSWEDRPLKGKRVKNVKMKQAELHL